MARNENGSRDDTEAPRGPWIPDALELRDPRELTDDPRNARRHDPAQLARLRESVRRHGIPKPIVVDGAGQIIAGHATKAVALELELAEVPVVVADHLDEWGRRGYALADNRIAELSTWDDETLAGELLELSLHDDDLEGVGWSAEELEELLDFRLDDEGAPSSSSTSRKSGRATVRATERGAKADETAEGVEEPPTRPAPQPGDLWRAGAHLVLCGDSQGEPAELLEALETKTGAVDLVVTDPPYAIFGSSNGVASDVADDTMVRPFFVGVMRLAAAALRQFGHLYAFCDWRSWPAVHAAAKSSGTDLVPGNLLVWDKGDWGLGSMWANCYELVAFLHRRPKKRSPRAKRESGSRQVHRPNILRYERPRLGDFEREQDRGEHHHNAQKPVDLLVELLTNASDEGALVFDPFLGSGSTMLAAEVSGRRCIGVEIDGARVEVALRRWEKLTGDEARRVSDDLTLDEAREGAP